MKKLILTLALVLGTIAVASAQPRAIGGRLGYGAEVSYQHTLGGENFVEADLGLFGFGGLNVAASYNFMIAQPNWTSRGEWGFYAGPGVAVGTGFTFEAAAIGVLANVGLEYTFWFPLQLSIDLRPQIGAAFNKDACIFYTGGLFGFIPTLGVRYRF